MHLRALVVVLCLLPSLSGSELGDLLRRASEAEAGKDPRQALEILQEADRVHPNDAVILQKIARQYSDLVVAQPNDETRRRYAQTALDYSQRAVALDPDNPTNVLSLAICHGKLAVYSDTRDKVRHSRLVREEAERALALDPNYAWAHHVLGRWHVEVATLGSTARFFLRVFYEDLPRASVAEGEKHLQRATELEPDELNHWLELGFAWRASGQRDKARAAWTRGLGMASRTVHDEPAKERAREQLAKLD